MTRSEKEQLFTSLFAENQARVLRLCRGYLNDEHEAEDLFQEVMTNVWNSLDGFRHEARITTWLYRIAVNSALLYRRKRQRAEAVVAAGPLPDRAAPGGTADEDRLRSLRAAIAELPEQDRLIVTLLLEGLSHKEIAEVTGITANYVGVKMSRIKQSLEKRITGVDHGRA